MPGEAATREDLREWRQDLQRDLEKIETTVLANAKAINDLAARVGSLELRQKLTDERNRAIPGWLFNSLGLAIPILAAALSWWLAARFPGLIGGP